MGEKKNQEQEARSDEMLREKLREHKLKSTPVGEEVSGSENGSRRKEGQQGKRRPGQRRLTRAGGVPSILAAPPRRPPRTVPDAEQALG